MLVLAVLMQCRRHLLDQFKPIAHLQSIRNQYAITCRRHLLDQFELYHASADPTMLTARLCRGALRRAVDMNSVANIRAASTDK